MRLFDQPHHDGSAMYVSTSKPTLGGVVTTWVRVPAGLAVTAIYVRTCPDGEPKFRPARLDEDRNGRAIGGYGTHDTWWRADVTAHNPVTRYRFMIRLADGGTRWLTAAGIADFDLPDSRDFRLVTHDAAPDWTADAVVYEIFPDRFARAASSGPLDPATLPDWAVPCDWDRDGVVAEGPLTPRQLYGGDLDGITERLDHVERLGANTIYLRPVFPARSNHRYDAAAFDRIDPLVGGEDALGRLADAMRSRGMRLIGDITTNHCGDSHEWFTTAAGDVTAAEREMFYFDDSGAYETWCGVKTLPKLNWASALVRDRIRLVLQRWSRVYDGWRVDVANMTGRRAGDDFNHEVARSLRRDVSGARPDALFLAEIAHDAGADLDRGGWDGTMNYAGFARPVWTWLRHGTLDLPDFMGVPGGVPARDGTSALTTMRAFAAEMSWRAYVTSWQPLDSYDTARIRTVTGSRELHLVAAGLQATLPGTPMICAGSEFGFTGRNGEDARTPMPWNRPADRDELTFDAYRTLLHLRAAEPALRHGGLRWLYADADTLVFAREMDDESLLVAARRAPGVPVVLPVDVPLAGVYQANDLRPREGVVTIPDAGPSLCIWRTVAAGHDSAAR